MIDLVELTCGKCGCVYGMNRVHYDEMKDTKGSFFCPNGDSRQFIGEPSKEKLERLRTQFRHLQDESTRNAQLNLRLKTQVKNLKAKTPKKGK